MRYRCLAGRCLAGPLLVAGLVVAPGLDGTARAQGDSARGAEISAEWCARCHNVAPGGAMKEEPPSFAAIAVYRSEGQMRDAMVAPHLGMPPLVEILGLEIDDLVAYISSLEPTVAWQPPAD
jgi:mono/diheme cytochrome c family protein